MPQPENMQFHFHAFSGWGTSQGPKLNLKAFSYKVVYNYYSKFFFGAFRLNLTKSKNLFPIVFSNLAGKGSGNFFQTRKRIFLPNGLYLPIKQPWGSPKFLF